MFKGYKEYKYLYETHLHTSQASACARNSGYDMAKAAKEYGYAGIFVTEHNWGGNTSIPWALSWNDWMALFRKGYDGACEYGNNHDLDVFWAYEAGYEGTEFLIYGVTPEWMLEHPELRGATIQKQYELVTAAGGMVVHAHPYREEWYIPEVRLFPKYVHAVEGINATHSNHKSTAHNDPEYDTKAIAYAKKHHFPMTAGSDVHSTDMFGGGVIFRKRLESAQEYIELIKSGDYMLTNGEVIYDHLGNVVAENM